MSLAPSLPTNGIFADGHNFNKIVEAVFSNKVVEIVDHGLIPKRDNDEASSSNTHKCYQEESKLSECLSSLLRIEIMCSEELQAIGKNIAT